MNEKEKQQIENLEEQIGILFKVVIKLNKELQHLKKFCLVMLNVLES